ncbi:MAG: hypothetical protein A2754_03830 [Candidatus Magasanikbacteria bacterium RIFCSPHIGHO2_01_FULL_47_8]|uniref:Uncharacterized protein n=1 Tax=Candidatus Magasanikbacteria bacterium RIFCSPHIGHO2_01_FULL_47_8 TaxID=1798673 RepID=A0A1F6MD24_9BACT|nr:MAG: hypothetical protein A2754_03830 [Candidatus Magasanikbacteria bacterium RIFCSPHIGHO2_01_FULL_47_8]
MSNESRLWVPCAKAGWLLREVARGLAAKKVLVEAWGHQLPEGFAPRVSKVAKEAVVVGHNGVQLFVTFSYRKEHSRENVMDAVWTATGPTYWPVDLQQVSISRKVFADFPDDCPVCGAPGIILGDSLECINKTCQNWRDRD